MESSKPLKKQRTLSSIENIRSKMIKYKNVQPLVIDNNVVGKFYAIHHADTQKKATSNHERKRTLAAAGEPQPKKKRQLIKKNCLYQTCHQLWPNESLNDTNYAYIKSLSDLLKVRLVQAKYKILSTLDRENELYSCLTKDANKTSKIPIHIKQYHRSSNAVIGNSKNLFNRLYKLQKRLSLPSFESTRKEDINKPLKICTKKKTSKRKRRRPPRRKPATTNQIMPVTLSDGSRMFVCEPCNKKYKNRNGLTYHMERCKNKKPNNEARKKSVQCICQITNDDNMDLIQCDKCRRWLHVECVNASKEDTFCCPQCQRAIAKKEEENDTALMDTSEDTLKDDSSQFHVWEDLDTCNEDEDEASMWNMNLPSSLLLSDITLHSEPTTSDTPHETWFQFANFDDDYPYQ